MSVPCNNPLLTAAQINSICTNAGLGPTDSATGLLFRRNVEGGGRQDDLRHTDYRIVWGVRGDIGKGWNYDVYGQYSTVVFNQRYSNDFSIARAGAALDVIADPVTGLAVCRIAATGAPPPPNTLNGCVPYDIWGPNGPSQASLNYIQTPGFASGETNEQVVSAQLTGNLGEYGLKSPMANDGIGIALGVEYRRESLEYFNDTAFSSGDLAGQGGPQLDIAGAFDVMEAFGEIRIPLVQDTPFFHDLTFEGGYRYSDYSLAGTTSTYKLALNWAPVEDIRFRGSYNRAVRAPNIIELFTPSQIGLGLSEDICSGPDPLTQFGYSAAQCAFTGVSASQYGRVPNNPANQYNALFGGNANLEPEIADSYSVGGVFTPTFFRGFTASVDYFNIKVENLISALNPDLILATCAENGDPVLCALISRAPGNGSLFTGASFVRGDNINVGALRTSGIDFEANYRLPVADWGMESIGGFDLSFQGTWLHKLETTEAIPAPGTNITTYDCKGLYGAGFCGTPNPEWRHRLRVTWTTPLDGLSVSVNWRYFGKVCNQNICSDNPYFDATPSQFTSDAVLSSQNYFDLSATWRVKDNYTLRLGVNNVFDRDPPLVGGLLGGVDARFNGNTFPVVYDALGRFIFMGVTADF